MATKKIDLGPTGETVRKNVERVRNDQRMTFAELSRRLDSVGNPIPALGLRRIEAGERRVHVDDLVALAYVLGTTPDALLTDAADTPETHVEATAVGALTARELWDWLRTGLVQRDGKIHILDSLNSEPPFVQRQNYERELEREYGSDLAQRIAALEKRIQDQADHGDD